MEKESINSHAVMAVLDIKNFPDLYKIVDFLNKNLKDRGLIFGLTKKDDETMRISIYEVGKMNK
ncbi:diaminopimelate epimerase [Caldicoprobacter guelmensis]|nr:diaminopimelate epimerase [Caldicoprobacter guelmensis]